MNMQYAFAAAVVGAAVLIAAIGVDRFEVAERPDRSVRPVSSATVAAAPLTAPSPGKTGRAAPASTPAAAATALAARPAEKVEMVAASLTVAPPPNALHCRETAAELRVAAGPVSEDFLEDFFLVSDPRELCRGNGLAASAGFDPESGRCYVLRRPGLGEPDLPLVCSEQISQGADGVSIGRISCQGWKRQIETAADGSFSFSLAERDSGRFSQGSCKPI